MCSKPRNHAFTIVELVVVVLILGILAVVAAPQVFVWGQEAAEQATIAQVQEIFRAAEVYYAEHGEWPGNTVAGELPAEFSGVLPAQTFTLLTPIGRQFDWNGIGTGMPTYGVSIPSGVADRVKLSIDQNHDDGDLGSGWITETPSGAINFALAPK